MNPAVRTEFDKAVGEALWLRAEQNALITHEDWVNYFDATENDDAEEDFDKEVRRVQVADTDMCAYFGRVLDAAEGRAILNCFLALGWYGGMLFRLSERAGVGGGAGFALTPTGLFHWKDGGCKPPTLVFAADVLQTPPETIVEQILAAIA